MEINSLLNLMKNGMTYEILNDTMENEYQSHYHGEMKLENGERYEGEMLAGRPFGKGKLIYKNGCEIHGSFLSGTVGAYVVNGTITWPNHASYTGEFKLKGSICTVA